MNPETKAYRPVNGVTTDKPEAQVKKEVESDCIVKMDKDPTLKMGGGMLLEKYGVDIAPMINRSAERTGEVVVSSVVIKDSAYSEEAMS
ncbi:hypothetical protein ACOSP7_007310 [Xanthoceras sorbifolium]